VYRQTIHAEPQQQDDRNPDLEEYHDRTLWAFLAAADELHRMGWTTAQLARMVERELAPAAVRFGAGESDPFDGRAA
jgi:hypothetical protein